MDQAEAVPRDIGAELIYLRPVLPTAVLGILLTVRLIGGRCLRPDRHREGVRHHRRTLLHRRLHRQRNDPEQIIDPQTLQPEGQAAAVRTFDLPAHAIRPPAPKGQALPGQQVLSRNHGGEPPPGESALSPLPKQEGKGFPLPGRGRTLQLRAKPPPGRDQAGQRRRGQQDQRRQAAPRPGGSRQHPGAQRQRQKNSV